MENEEFFLYFSKEAKELDPEGNLFSVIIQYIQNQVDKLHEIRKDSHEELKQRKNEREIPLKKRLSNVQWNKIKKTKELVSENILKNFHLKTIGIKTFSDFCSFLTVKIYKTYIKLWDFPQKFPFSLPVIHDLLVSINQKRIPSFISNILFEFGFSVYYDGFLAINVIDCRGKENITEKILLQPDSTAIPSEMDNVRLLGVPDDVLFNIEKDFLLKTEKTLCLFPSINTMHVLSYFNNDTKAYRNVSEHSINELSKEDHETRGNESVSCYNCFIERKKELFEKITIKVVEHKKESFFYFIISENIFNENNVKSIMVSILKKKEDHEENVSLQKIFENKKDAKDFVLMVQQTLKIQFKNLCIIETFSKELNN